LNLSIFAYRFWTAPGGANGRHTTRRAGPSKSANF